MVLQSGCTPVARVIDGDTILATNNEFVRYIGIDAPERGEVYYEEAKLVNAKLLAWKHISFESDVNDKDRYGRLLRYVFADNLLVNAELVRRGYALTYREDIFPEQKYYQTLEKAADEAILNRRGIWGMKSPHTKLQSSHEYYISDNYFGEL